MSTFRKNNGKDIVVGFGSNNKKLVKKLRKSKNQKLFKSQKLAKFKKLSKSRNSPNFSTIKAGPSFLISDTRKTFNYLRLAFIKALIFQYFDLKSYF